VSGLRASDHCSSALEVSRALHPQAVVGARRLIGSVVVLRSKDFRKDICGRERCRITSYLPGPQAWSQVLQLDLQIRAESGGDAQGGTMAQWIRKTAFRLPWHPLLRFQLGVEVDQVASRKTSPKEGCSVCCGIFRAISTPHQLRFGPPW
jgi:hypothetical protein